MSQANKEENTTFGFSKTTVPSLNSGWRQSRGSWMEGTESHSPEHTCPQEPGVASRLHPTPLPICLRTKLGSQDPHPIPLLRETPHPPLQSGTVFSGFW